MIEQPIDRVFELVLRIYTVNAPYFSMYLHVSAYDVNPLSSLKIPGRILDGPGLRIEDNIIYYNII